MNKLIVKKDRVKRGRVDRLLVDRLLVERLLVESTRQYEYSVSVIPLNL